jgi:hypothetical protein
MAVLFLTCSSFLLEQTVSHTTQPNKSLTGKKFFDFNVRRFSGEKVFLSWHTEDDSPQIVYEVLRKHKKLSQFVSLGVIKPKSLDGNVADYSFIDVNNYTDSSFYCLKKTAPDSVIFYSITKAVEGTGRSR